MIELVTIVRSGGLGQIKCEEEEKVTEVINDISTDFLTLCQNLLILCCFKIIVIIKFCTIRNMEKKEHLITLKITNTMSDWFVWISFNYWN